jgi:hypothetical protein
MGKDYYKILEVDKNADEKALKKSKLIYTLYMLVYIVPFSVFRAHLSRSGRTF